MQRDIMRDSDDELPDGVYRDDEWQTVPCRYCRAEIAEESEQCPRCGNYQSAEDAPRSERSYFWLIMMILAAICVAFWAIA